MGTISRSTDQSIAIERMEGIIGYFNEKIETEDLRPQEVNETENVIFSYYLAIKDIDENYRLPESVQKVINAAKEFLVHEGELGEEDLLEFYNVYKLLKIVDEKDHFIMKKARKLKEKGFQNYKFLKLEKRNGRSAPKIVLAADKTIEVTESFLATHRDLTSFGLRSFSSKDTLEPIFKVKGDGKYYASVMISEKHTHLIMDDHAWLRLRDADGKIYCVGNYPKNMVPLIKYFSDVEGNRIQSDPYEWTSKGCKPRKEHKIPLTAKEFKALKRDIEKDLTPESRDFNLTRNNCTKWVYDKIYPFVKEYIPEERVQTTLFAGTTSRCLLDRIPDFCKRIFDKTPRILPLIYHPRCLDRMLSACQDKLEKRITTIKSEKIIRPSKSKHRRRAAPKRKERKAYRIH
jgi:hypothetical protein